MSDQAPTVFPAENERPRLDRYKHYDRLYFGEHYDAFTIKVQQDFSKRYQQLRYIVGNFSGLMSRVCADMLFGETPTFDFEKDDNQKFTDALFEDNQLLSQLHESALGNSRRGDAVFKIRTGQRNPQNLQSPETVIIEEVTPMIYFPVLDDMSTRNVPKEDRIAMVFERGGVTYLHIETHVPGKITHQFYTYSKSENRIIAEVGPEQFEYQAEQDTGVDKSLIVHIPNVRDSSGFWGTSDYYDLESLFFALNNRMTKTDNILDKHSDPILAVPPGVINEDGKINKEALGMFEVDSENPGFNKPEYIVWNANLESAFSQIDKLVDMLFIFSEISPASIAKDKDGAAESGRALKFKLLSTIRKVRRKQRYYDQGIKDMLEIAMALAKSQNISINGVSPADTERAKIKWSDGVLNDEVEMTEMVGMRIDQGTMSVADGIAKLDSITPEEAKKKAKEIDEEKPKLPPIMNNLNADGPPKPGQNPGDPKQPEQPEQQNQPQGAPALRR